MQGKGERRLGGVLPAAGRHDASSGDGAAWGRWGRPQRRSHWVVDVAARLEVAGATLADGGRRRRAWAGEALVDGAATVAPCFKEESKRKT